MRCVVRRVQIAALKAYRPVVHTLACPVSVVHADPYLVYEQNCSPSCRDLERDLQVILEGTRVVTQLADCEFVQWSLEVFTDQFCGSRLSYS